MRLGACCAAAVLGGIAVVTWASSSARASDDLRVRHATTTHSTFASVPVSFVPAALSPNVVAAPTTSATLASAPPRHGPRVVAEDPNAVPVGVPLGAGVVAVIASIGALIASRRSDRRAAAMARHPAQRGVGLAPRRARR